MKDYAIIGSGIGGSLSALELSKNNDIILFEKEPYLGGCSSTFKRKKYFYNSGATTFAGYSEGTPFYNCIAPFNIEFKKKLLDSTSSVIINSKKIIRYKDLDKFLNSLNDTFANTKHKLFYEMVQKINEDFYKINNYYYSSKSNFHKLKSMWSFKDIGMKFYPLILQNGYDFINKFYDGIDKSYLDYIDNQVLIVAQAKTKEINALTLILALGYQFLDNYYIFGGMGSTFEAISEKIKDIEYKTLIEKIEVKNDYFEIYAKNKEYKTKNIVLNSSIFDSVQLFSNKNIIRYLQSYNKLYESKSAYMVYIKLETQKIFDHHYQIICDDVFPNSISNSIFVSFGDIEDEKMKDSVTISIHTDINFWKEDEKKKRQILKNEILKVFKETLGVKEEEIKECFDATPFTFKKFINRTTLGGNPITVKNLFYKLPSNDTPFKGLYLVGDTTFAAQGWMGVSMGVQNLKRLINEKK